MFLVTRKYVSISRCSPVMRVIPTFHIVRLTVRVFNRLKYEFANLTNKRCNENNLNIIFTNINMNGKVKKERERIYYYRGLKEFESERGYLADICLSAQDAYKDLIRYFI